MNVRPRLLDQNITVVLPRDVYDRLKEACKLRGENISVFSRRAIYTEMGKLGLSPSRKGGAMEV
jgi:hypothetical protein